MVCGTEIENCRKHLMYSFPQAFCLTMLKTRQKRERKCKGFYSKNLEKEKDQALASDWSEKRPIENEQLR